MSYPIFRPAVLDDLPAIIRFANQAAYGITSLPRVKSALEHKIQKSQRSFQERLNGDPHQIYLFCLEWEGNVIGTSGIISRIGMDEPFYAYHLLNEPLRSAYLGIGRDTGVLHFTRAHKKPSEIGTLFLSKDFRGKEFGKLLSLSRFLFIAAFKERFAPTIIAELRGVNHSGVSPFWEAIGRPFFQIDFPSADVLRTQHYSIIEELFPKHPIYVELLPTPAQEVIGIPHKDTLGALKILEEQGFKKSPYVDIFDGGPHLFAPTNAIHTVLASRVAKVRELRSSMPDSTLYILSNDSINFRSTLAPVLIEEGELIIPSEAARSLNIDVGDSVRFYTP